MNKAKFQIGVAFAALMVAAPSYAQSNLPSGDSTNAPTASAPSAAGDIIVTANKREQKLNDVGITVAVVSGNDFKAHQINNLQDLAATIPSLSFSTTQSGAPVYTLRGVGFNDTTLGAYPTVSVYLDEAPLPFSVLAKHSAFDLERVEVLKGPQGTLFGQNSTGGAINYIAAKPTNKFDAGIDLTYGRYNQVIGEGYVSGPLTDNLKARIAGRIERMDGWQISNSRPNDRNGRVRNYMGRAVIAFTPADSLRFTLDVNGWKEGGDTIAPQFSGLNVQHPGFADPGVLSTPFSPENPRAADWNPGLPFQDNRLWQASLKAEWDVADHLTLTSLTNYVDYRQRQAQDTDGLPVSTGDFAAYDGRIKTFTQELRLGNGASGRLRWLIGGNLEHSTVSAFYDNVFGQSSTTNAFGAFGYPIDTVLQQQNLTMRNYAGFANAEYDIASKLTLKASGRFTSSWERGSVCAGSTTRPTDTGALFYDVVLGGAYGPYKAGDCFAYNDLGYTLSGVAPGAPGVYRNTFHQNNFSWKVGVDYKPRPGFLIYANVARGYKSGGFPDTAASNFSQFEPVKQESVMSYEAGFKASLLDRTLQLNGAGFYYDYTDKQLRAKIDTIYGILDSVVNIPKSSIRGFEIEATARPTRGLSISEALTYVDARIDRYTGINGAGLAGNFAGSRMPFTPRYQINTAIDYEFALNSAVNAFFGGNLTYRSDTVSVVGGDTNVAGSLPVGKGIYSIGDYALVDARLGVKSADDRWRASIFGKNIFNTYYWNNVTQAIDAASRYAGMGATYGVNLQMRFR